MSVGFKKQQERHNDDNLTSMQLAIRDRRRREIQLEQQRQQQRQAAEDLKSARVGLLVLRRPKDEREQRDFFRRVDAVIFAAKRSNMRFQWAGENSDVFTMTLAAKVRIAS